MVRHLVAVRLRLGVVGGNVVLIMLNLKMARMELEVVMAVMA